MERDLQSLLDMLQSSKIVMSYVTGRSRSDLDIDLQFQDSVVHRLLIIGEASKRVSETMRQQVSTLPWTAISGMRNRLVYPAVMAVPKMLGHSVTLTGKSFSVARVLHLPENCYIVWLVYLYFNFVLRLVGSPGMC